MDVKFSFGITRLSDIGESIFSQKYTGTAPYPADQVALNLIFSRKKLLFTRTFTVKRVFMTYTEIVFSFNLTKAVYRQQRVIQFTLCRIFLVSFRAFQQWKFARDTYRVSLPCRRKIYRLTDCAYSFVTLKFVHN